MSYKIVIGEGSCGIAAGARKIHAALDALNAQNAADAVEIGAVGCIGACFLEPIVELHDAAGLVRRLVHVKEADAARIHAAARAGDAAAVADLAVAPEDAAFLERQTRIVLRKCGVIDPESLAAARAAGAYDALAKVLASFTPEGVVDEIKRAGLAGRGGAGFPTWFKWDAARRAPGADKYLVCNADEGDPGAFMDRALIEGDPHALLEGMLIAAYAIGARACFVYVRAEYPLAIVRLEKAIAEARAAHLLGEGILGSGFSCDVHVKQGAGAFVCGEETALLESLEGRRGMPRLKPPFPATCGYAAAPTNINNVETFANVSWIFLNGADKFAALGTEKSKGTKVFALTGKVKRGGLVEVPMGKTVRDVVFGIGGGVREGRQFKAVQLGGPSGGCIPEALLDVQIDYAALAATGAIMGSGGMVVMDDSACMVDVARFFLDFTARESCGKCVPCRIGTKRMYEILSRIVAGKGEEGDVERLEELCAGVKAGALCGLGQTAPNPVLTTLKYFRDEYVAHVAEKRCPAHACPALVHYAIDAAACRGCTLCTRKCPAGAIAGAPRSPHAIDPAKCVACGACFAACPFGAVRKA